MTIRDQVKRDIENGLKAEVRTQAGSDGVFFHDTNEYVPFSELVYNEQTGYQRIERPRPVYVVPANARGEPITWVGAGMGIAWGFVLISIPLGIILFVLSLFLGF